MIGRPLVSVGLPVHNGESYLDEVIRSVLSQTYKNFELVICDNASNDNTSQICMHYVNLDGRVQYYRNKHNLGAAANFNKTFMLSSGEYFKWIAHDAAIKPTFLEKCLEIFEKRPEAILVCTKYVSWIENENSNFVTDLNFEISRCSGYRRLRAIFDKIIGTNLAIWGLIKTDVLKTTKLIRPFIGSDSVFLVELGLKGDFYQVPEYLALARRHDDSYSDMKKKSDWVEGIFEAKWFDPRNNRKRYFPHWRRLWEYGKMIVGAEKNNWEKPMMLTLLVYPVACRWRKVLLKELFYAFGFKKYWIALGKLFRG